MNAFFSLLSDLVWPAFFLYLIFLARDELLQILRSIRLRVEKGDEFSAGPSGLKLGTSPGTTVEKYNEAQQDDGLEEDQLNPGIYLVHKTRRDQTLDRDGYEYFRFRIFLENDDGASLRIVEKVIYHLHPTFPDPDRQVDDPDTKFELRTYGWGQFNLKADVYIKDWEKPLQLERYLNF